MREMSINMYNLMRYKTFGGVGVADIRELHDILKTKQRKNELANQRRGFRCLTTKNL